MKKYLLLFLFAALSFSCKKEDAKPEPVTTTPASTTLPPSDVIIDYTLAFSYCTRIFNVLDESFMTGTYSACAIITYDSLNASDNDTLTVDFGSVGCIDMFGRNNKGKIVCVYTNGYNDSLATKTISFVNYFVDNIQIEENITITNNGRNTSGNQVYSFSCSGTLIKTSGTISFNSSLSAEQVAGVVTGSFLDDSWSITGTSSGIAREGTNFTAAITQAVVKDIACLWHKSGKVDQTTPGYLSGLIDYGVGTCDDQAFITYGTNTFVFTLD